MKNLEKGIATRVRENMYRVRIKGKANLFDDKEWVNLTEDVRVAVTPLGYYVTKEEIGTVPALYVGRKIDEGYFVNSVFIMVDGEIRRNTSLDEQEKYNCSFTDKIEGKEPIGTYTLEEGSYILELDLDKELIERHGFG